MVLYVFNVCKVFSIVYQVFSILYDVFVIVFYVFVIVNDVFVIVYDVIDFQDTSSSASSDHRHPGSVTDQVESKNFAFHETVHFDAGKK